MWHDNKRILKDKQDIRCRWLYFEELLKVTNQREAIVTWIGIMEDGGRVYEQYDVKKGDV